MHNWMATPEEVSTIKEMLEYAAEMAEINLYRFALTESLKVVDEDRTNGERILESVYY